ncbi:hypothetical protein F5883DRAFT_212100 [Diaporthe sp. PMI_573]|nr:hypothetical protein F5883DRAFT_212100 [Diaporthaceae sp. PMI_573]
MDFPIPNTQGFRALQQNFRNCLGSSFWDNHEESSMLLECVRMVNKTHKLFDQDIKTPGLYENKQQREKFLDSRYPGVRKCLIAMGPYLDQPPEVVTGRIAHELQNGNMCWFNCFTEFMHWVNFTSPSNFSDEIKLIINLDPWDWETVGRA